MTDLARRRDEPAGERWCCESCGADVEERYLVIGHTRSEHEDGCDGGCDNCPVPISCGPVSKTLTDRRAAPTDEGPSESGRGNERTCSPKGGLASTDAARSPSLTDRRAASGGTDERGCINARQTGITCASGFCPRTPRCDLSAPALTHGVTGHVIVEKTRPSKEPTSGAGERVVDPCDCGSGLRKRYCSTCALRVTGAGERGAP